MGVAIGIDSHKGSLGVGVVDALGRVVAAREFANDVKGHRALHGWVTSQGEGRMVGIEGAGSYGFALAQLLVAVGEEVKEVPAFMTHRERKKAPAKGKSDVSDAVAIARVVARGECLPSVSVVGVSADLKLLSDRRDQLVCHRTLVANQVHADLAVLRPGYDACIPRLTATKHLTAALTLIRGDRSVRADLVRDRIEELRSLDRKIADVTKQIAAKVVESGTKLTEIKGIGFVLAAKILGEVGDVSRFRSAGAFAMFNGTAPLEASSGSIKRHRLNRGGNRQLNRALHVIALVRSHRDADTKAYLSRQKTEGKTSREALRSLKRHLSNVVYRHLMGDVVAAGIAA